MDVDLIKTRLVEIEEPLSIRGYLRAPHDIAQTDLPVALHYIRGADHSQEDKGQLIDVEEREVIIRVLVVPIQEGISGEAEETVEPLINLMNQALLSRPSLTTPTSPTPMPGLQRMRLVRDSGIVTIPYPDQTTLYLGVEFTLRLLLYSNYSLGNKE